MTWLPYAVMLAVLGGMVLYSFNRRRRQLAIEMVQQSQLAPGSQVMTTSGLYGTVVECSDEGTVLLSIAPGVEVKWALAALRDVRSLPPRYSPTDPPDRPGEVERADPNSPGAADIS